MRNDITSASNLPDALSLCCFENQPAALVVVAWRRPQLLDLAAQVFDILELAVDRGEADVGDLVEGFQLAQHALPDCAGGDFGSASGQEIGFDAGQDVVDRILTDRALGERHPELLAQLDRIEVLAAAVLLDDHQIGALDPFVGREAPTADRALPAAANAVAPAQLAAVDDPGVVRTAERAAHASASGPLAVIQQHRSRSLIARAGT